MGKIERSWELVKASWAVLRADKELMIFPVLSMIAVTIVMATFAVPLFLSGILEGSFARTGGIPIIAIFVAFAFLRGPIHGDLLLQLGAGGGRHDPSQRR